MGLVRPAEGLLQARALRDGSFELTETGGDIADCVRRLREYDPELSLVYNTQERRYEVWRTCEDREPRLICTRRTPAGRVPSGAKLVEFLASHDTRRGFDPIASIERHEAALERDRQREIDDELDEAGEKLHHALAKDLDEPAPPGRLYPLGG